MLNKSGPHVNQEGFLQYQNARSGFKYLVFSPQKLGEDELILTSIFSNWVVQPPTRQNLHEINDFKVRVLFSTRTCSIGALTLEGEMVSILAVFLCCNQLPPKTRQRSRKEGFQVWLHLPTFCVFFFKEPAVKSMRSFNGMVRIKEANLATVNLRDLACETVDGSETLHQPPGT